MRLLVLLGTFGIVLAAVAWYASVLYVSWPYALIYWPLWILAAVFVWLAYGANEERLELWRISRRYARKDRDEIEVAANERPSTARRHR